MRQEGLNLKIALWTRRVSQNELARRTGLNRSIISLVVTGRYNLDDAQRARIAEALKATPQEIFERGQNHP